MRRRKIRDQILEAKRNRDDEKFLAEKVTGDYGEFQRAQNELDELIRQYKNGGR